VAQQALSCPLYAAEVGGSICDVRGGIDAVAIAPYFGSYLAQSAYQSTVQSWMAMADGGLDMLFEEINVGVLPRSIAPGVGTPVSWLSQMQSSLTSNKQVADSHGVPLLGYEGGQEMTATGSDTFQTNLLHLIQAANRDPRMGTFYTAMFNTWKASGAELYVAFETTGAYTASRGMSPYKEYQGQPIAAAPKYAAAMDFITTNPCWWSGCGAPVLVPSVVRIAETGIVYASLQAACDVAITGNTIQAQTGVIDENVVYGNPATVALYGGYDVGFSNSTGATLIVGSLTIGAGSIEMANIIIE
jgi:hypothetical protein